METLAERLLAFRRYKKLTQTEFAEIATITQGNVNHYETGKSYPDRNKTVAIKNAFPELNIDWLVEGKGEMLKESVDLPRINKEDKYKMLYEQEQAKVNILLEKQVELLTEINSLLRRSKKD